MKAHKGGYVNKTNEKPVLRGEGEQGEKGTVRDLLFVKGCSIYSQHRRSEWCHHGGITWHLLMAAKKTTLTSASQLSERRCVEETPPVVGDHTCN